MDSETELYLMRAEDEYLLSQKDMQLSIDMKTKELMGITKEKTFFYSVISHAYYSIFYCTKAYLLTKGIKTFQPNEHKKTYNALKKLVRKSILQQDLLRIYETEVLKANSLLHIFKEEKTKRGTFTYQMKSEANVPFANESIENARNFISSIKAIISQ
jgi:uncharacterized protein (UPF0332 family)